MDAGRAPGDLEPAASTSKSPGELLREERIRRRLSIQQAAEDLHLDVRSVEALESNNFQALGPPVYAKGHLRKYAALLGLAPDVIIARYHMLNDVPQAPMPVPARLLRPPQERMSFTLPPFRMPNIRVPVVRVSWPAVLSATALVMVGLAVRLVTAWDSQEREQARAKAAADAAAAAVVAAQQEVVAQPPPVRDPNQVIVWFEFSEASWVEVVDATGARLSYDIAQAGELRKISGQAPLKVALGAASVVRMRMNDLAVEIPQQSSRGVTRFELAADGSVH